MTIAIWIIAICEVIRAIQNMVQIGALMGDKKARDNVYSEFVKSLKITDKEFVENMLKRFKEIHDGE